MLVAFGIILPTELGWASKPWPEGLAQGLRAEGSGRFLLIHLSSAGSLIICVFST